MITPDQVLGSPRRGISLAFITDTRPTEQLSTFARDVELLICESMYDEPEDLPLAKAHAHMLAGEAAGIRQGAGADPLPRAPFQPQNTPPLVADEPPQRVCPSIYGPMCRSVINREHPSLIG